MKMTGDTVLFTGVGYNSDQLHLTVWLYNITIEFTGSKMPATGEQISKGSRYLDEGKGGPFMIKKTY